MAEPELPSPSDPPPTFEQALQRLQAVVRTLEDGEVGLNQALEEYEQGVRLLKHCLQLLSRAERRIELLSGVDGEGRAICADFDDQEQSLDEKAAARSRRRSSADKPPKPESKKQGGALSPRDVDTSEGLF